MSNEKRDIAWFRRGAEDQLESLKQQYRERFGSERTLAIVPYMGYGSPSQLRVSGRVLLSPGNTTYRDNKDLWDNLGDMYRRFESDALPNPSVRAQYGDSHVEGEGDEEGLFHLDIAIDGKLSHEQVWHDVDLVLLDDENDDMETRSVGKVMVPPLSVRFGVISDIDDTVIYSHAKDLLNMARTVIFEDARGRIPFPGVAAFYRALYAGTNPLFYVSSSPWNMYDLFVDLFDLRQIPPGPFFLREWGIKPGNYVHREHVQYKLQTIRPILDFYAHLSFICIGDSGQQDPEIYSQLISLYPGRIQAVYIRHVSPDEERAQEVMAIADAVREMGTPMILAEDTLTMAKHAAKKGWISDEDVSTILAEMKEEQ